MSFIQQTLTFDEYKNLIKPLFHTIAKEVLAKRSNVVFAHACENSMTLSVKTNLFDLTFQVDRDYYRDILFEIKVSERVGEHGRYEWKALQKKSDLTLIDELEKEFEMLLELMAPGEGYTTKPRNTIKGLILGLAAEAEIALIDEKKPIKLDDESVDIKVQNPLQKKGFLGKFLDIFKIL